MDRRRTELESAAEPKLHPPDVTAAILSRRHVRHSDVARAETQVPLSPVHVPRREAIPIRAATLATAVAGGRDPQRPYTLHSKHGRGAREEKKLVEPIGA
jgi:hypothetical protein